MMEKDAKPVALKTEKRILLYLWMLPQNLLGRLVLFVCRKNKIFMERFNECDVYAIESKLLSGGSLGKYIFLNSVFVPDRDKFREAVKHEYGHFRQGKIFGFFYLLAIGIPSLLNNLAARKNKKVFDRYYLRYPEKWADKLGRVRR